MAVSLNVKDRVHAVVWNVGGLPTTINQCFSLPTPIGGACLFGSNEVIYLNQAVPPCGLALNSNVDEFTRFPFATETKSLHMTLDGCVVEAISESELLIATRIGEFYLLSLNVDISNAVKQMKIQKVYGELDFYSKNNSIFRICNTIHINCMLSWLCLFGLKAWRFTIIAIHTRSSARKWSTAQSNFK